MPKFAPSIFSSTDTIRPLPQKSRLRCSSHILSSFVAAPRFSRWDVLGNFSSRSLRKARSKRSSSSTPGVWGRFSFFLHSSRHLRSLSSTTERSPSSWMASSCPRARSSTGRASLCLFSMTRANARQRSAISLLGASSDSAAACSSTSSGLLSKPSCRQSTSSAEASPAVSPCPSAHRRAARANSPAASASSGPPPASRICRARAASRAPAGCSGRPPARDDASLERPCTSWLLNPSVTWKSWGASPSLRRAAAPPGHSAARKAASEPSSRARPTPSGTQASPVGCAWASAAAARAMPARSSDAGSGTSFGSSSVHGSWVSSRALSLRRSPTAFMSAFVRKVM
mmetsp:Transcript_26067/g.77890  ORF Transcript_26067/g.77890 Transcript_26067/m.77890 type:complete len:343 (+) Transcript_26067:3338-4366(+)